jgi:1-deoxy-D-xylulose-5-phosphate synthase
VIDPSLETIPIGKGLLRRQSGRQSLGQGGAGRVAILAFGTLLHPALQAAQILDATVADMRCVKPLDVELLVELAMTHDALITIEEHAVMGGAGSACAEALAATGIERPLQILGLPDRFIDHGDHQKLLAAEGLDAKGIGHSVRQRFAHWVGLEVDSSAPAASSLSA